MYDDSKNDVIEDYDEQFKILLKGIAGLITEESGGIFNGFSEPLPAPPLGPAELARQIAIVIREEFEAAIAVTGASIRMIFPDRTFVLKVSKA